MAINPNGPWRHGPRSVRKGSADWTDADYMTSWKARCIVTESGCWEWQGFCLLFRNIKPGQRGYASTSYRGKCVRLHKKVLEMKLGRKLVKGELACHACDNPPCINPDHLEPGSQEKNKLDEVARGRSFYANKTHCPRNHEYTPENTSRTKNAKGRLRRVCRECMRIKGFQRYHGADVPVPPRLIAFKTRNCSPPTGLKP